MHRLVNDIHKSLEEKTLCTAAFLNVQQAFDRVWHNGLLYKLKTALPTPYYLLFLSYLTDRNFQIKHNTATSTIVPFRSGVPQGSVLGPLLYLLFTADIPTTQNTTIATFADDSVIIAANEDPPPCVSLYLQTHLDLLQDWLRTCASRSMRPNKLTSPLQTEKLTAPQSLSTEDGYQCNAR